MQKSRFFSASCRSFSTFCLLPFAFVLAQSGCAKTPPATAPVSAVTIPEAQAPASAAAALTETPAPEAIPAAPAATVAASVAPPEMPESPRQRLQQIIDTVVSGPGVSRGTWGIVVQSLTGRERLYERNPRTLLVPASTAKLVSLAAAVDAVGWDYRFETTLRATGPIVNGVLRGDLIVVGSGDPTIGGRAGDDLTGFVAAVKAAGIRRIQGRVIGDDDAIEEPRPGAMWAWDDLGYTSGALFGALNFGENRMAVTVAPAGVADLPAMLTVESKADDRPLANRARTGTRGSPQLLWPEQRPGEPFLTIAGSIPLGAQPATLSVSVGNPTIWFAGALRNQLQRSGIEVTGKAVDIDDVSPKPDSSTARVLFAYRSHPLSQIAQPLLKESINIYGEAALRLSSGAAGGRTNDDALAAIRNRLPSWGLQADAVQVVDGSGLSRRDAVAAETFLVVLQRMYDASGLSPWMAGLPVAGRDGTLVNRLKDTPAANNLQAKTGTMSNIRSLAGYVRTQDGEPLAFVIMVNNFEGMGAQATAAIDAIAVSLASFRRSE